MSKLFGTPTLTPEKAAQQLKSHFEHLELDHETIKKETLASDVHDYIVNRNDPNFSFADRRKAVRHILYQTNILEGMLTRLINDGQFARYGADFALVTSTRLTFISEQAFLEASIREVGQGSTKITTNTRKRNVGLSILANEAEKHLITMAHQVKTFTQSDHTKVKCLRKPPNLRWFAVDGTPLGNGLAGHNARDQYCFEWMFSSRNAKHDLPSAAFFLKGGFALHNPKNHDQVMYRYKGDGAYWLGVAHGEKEGIRQSVARSMDRYAEQIGLPSHTIASLAETVKMFGTPEQKEHATYIHKYFFELESPL